MVLKWPLGQRTGLSRYGAIKIKILNMGGFLSNKIWAVDVFDCIILEGFIEQRSL